MTKTKNNLSKLYDTSYPQLHIPYSNIYKMVKTDVEENIFEDRDDDDKIYENYLKLILKSINNFF